MSVLGAEYGQTLAIVNILGKVDGEGSYGELQRYTRGRTLIRVRF